MGIKLSTKEQNYNLYVIVDDQEVNRWLLEKFISREDPSAIVLSCSSGEDAIIRVSDALGSNYTISAIIMDLQMPGMDGDIALMEICKRYREITGRSTREDNVECTIFTANTEFKRKQECPNNKECLGCYGVEYKPATRNKVLRMLGL